MIQRTRLTKLKDAFNGTESFVRRAKNQSLDPGLNEGAGAHRARFYGRIKRRFSQPIIADFLGRFTKNQDFGMRRRVTIGSGSIPVDRQNFTLPIYQTGAD